MRSFYAEDIEFFHDMSGLATSKKDIIEAIKKNICGKVKENWFKAVWRCMKYQIMELWPLAIISFTIWWRRVFRNLQNLFHFGEKQTNRWEMAKVVSLH